MVFADTVFGGIVSHKVIQTPKDLQSGLGTLSRVGASRRSTRNDENFFWRGAFIARAKLLWQSCVSGDACSETQGWLDQRRVSDRHDGV